MELLLILTYAAFACAIFKFFKIPVNGFSLLTAALGGGAMLAALVLGMNYNHPFTTQGRFYFTTTPIVPTVEGRVIEVPVQPNTPLKAGDVLFRIDPERYENAVKSLQAQLADAKQVTEQLKAAADRAVQNAQASMAAMNAARDVYERAQKLIDSGAISAVQFKQSEEKYFGARSEAEAAQSEATRADLEANSAIGGINTDVARIQADLDTAQYNLEQTVVRAPTDGTVAQLFLRPGMYTIPMPLRPVMVFLHAEEPTFSGAFVQNSSQRIIEGAYAEVILPAVPGYVFKGRVAKAGAYIPQGQLQPGGTLLDPSQIKGDGRIIVEIEITDDLSCFNIVPGSIGNVAVYTEHMHHLAMMRKVLLRMKSWMNFLFGEGHGGGSGGH
jgi:multidrug resistance efflux pump